MHLSLLLLSLASAQTPALDQATEARRLVKDPDRVDEALRSIVEAATAAPEDPRVFAALTEVVRTARGPVLNAPLPVAEAAFASGGKVVITRSVPGGTHFYSVVDGEEKARATEVAAPPAPVKLEVSEVGGRCELSDGTGLVARLEPCEDVIDVAASADRTRAVVLTASEWKSYSETLWNLESGESLVVMRTDVNPAGAWRAFFNADGTRLFTYDNAGAIPQSLWDPRSGEVVAQLGPVQRDGRFTPAGERLVLADGDLQVFDTEDGVLVGRLGVEVAGWRPLVFQEDGRHLVVPDGNGTVVWDVYDGSTARVSGAWDVRGSDGRLVLEGLSRGPVRVVDTGPAEARAVLGTPGDALSALAISKNGWVASLSHTTLRVFDPLGDESLVVQQENVRWLVFNGPLLVSSSGEAWDMRTLASVGTGLFRYLEQVTPGPGGIAYSYDRTWRPPSRFRTLLDNSTLVRLPRDPRIVPNPAGRSFSADAARFAGATGAEVGVWETASGRALFMARGELPVAVAPVAPRVAALDVGTVRVWDLTEGELAAVVPRDPPVSLDLSPQGTRLVTGAESGRVALWNVEDGSRLATLPGHEAVMTVRFSPDGTTLMTVGPGLVQLWDAALGLHLASWPAAQDPLAQYSADGREIALADAEGRVVVYPATAQGYLAVACRWLRFDPQAPLVCKAR